MQPCWVCLPLLRSEPVCQQQKEQQEFFHVRCSRLALDFVSGPGLHFFDKQEPIRYPGQIILALEVISVVTRAHVLTAMSARAILHQSGIFPARHRSQIYSVCHILRSMIEKNRTSSSSGDPLSNTVATDRTPAIFPCLPSGTRIWSLVFLYLALTVAFTTPWVLLLLHAQSFDIGRGFVIHTQMWAPALAAFTCCAVCRIPWEFLGFRWPGIRAIAWGYLLPVAYATTAYLFVWSTKLAPADFAGFLRASQKSLHFGTGAGVLNAALIMTFGVLQSGVSATGEEIGWRGFLVPVLAQRLNFTGVALASGLIWALWHFPLIVFGTYSSSAPKWVALLCFTVMIIATGALAAWLRLKTGSVWPAAMLHACHKAVIQWLFDSMTVETGRAAWFAGEFGIALAVVSVLFAIPFWR